VHVGNGGKRFQGDIYCEAMPDSVAQVYLKAIQDPELLTCKKEAALAAWLQTETLQRVGTGESGSNWRGLRNAWRVYCEAMARIDGGDSRAASAAEEALSEIGQRIEIGASAEDAKSEVERWGRFKADMAEKENKRLSDMDAAISVEQTLSLMSVVVAAVCRVIPDLETQSLVAAEVSRIFHEGDNGMPVPPELRLAARLALPELDMETELDNR